MIGTLVSTARRPTPYRGQAGQKPCSSLSGSWIWSTGSRSGKSALANMIGVDPMPYASACRTGTARPSSTTAATIRVRGSGARRLGRTRRARAHQKAMLREGRFVGLGLAPMWKAPRRPRERDRGLDASRHFSSRPSLCAGQGHETVFAQVAADEWGVTPDKITIVVSIHRRHGYGTIASRSVNSSNAIRLASQACGRRFSPSRRISGTALTILNSMTDMSVSKVLNLRLSLKRSRRPGAPAGQSPATGMPGGLE